MIIGFGHKKQVGKNTTANIMQIILEDSIVDKKTVLAELFRGQPLNINYTWSIKGFADKLKEVASVIFDIKREDWDDPLIKASYIPGTSLTGREILQKIGESFRREIDPYIWVDTLLNEYDSKKYFANINKTSEPNWFIADVRMLNEAEAIKSRGGILIKIERDTNYADNHISETSLDNYDDWDYTIDNNGSLDELVCKVEQLCEQIIQLQKKS